MRYLLDEKKILISSKEFVSIARRGIGASQVSEEEPCPLECGDPMERITLEFKLGEIDYILEGYAEETAPDLLSIRFPVYGRPEKPSKAELAQARGEAFVLAYAHCLANKLSSLTVFITYESRRFGENKKVSETVSLKKLDAFFNKCKVSLAVYGGPEIDRVTKRLPSLKTLKFPYTSARDGQGDFARSVYKSLSRGGTLFACAPTGTGKTVSVLFPALRALGDEKIDKVFYLTPKGTTAEAVRECLLTMESGGATIRAVILSSKEKCCKTIFAAEKVARFARMHLQKSYLMP